MIVSEARGCVDKVPDVKATCSVDPDFIIPIYPKSAEALCIYNETDWHVSLGDLYGNINF